MSEPIFALTMDTDWIPEEGLVRVLDAFFQDVPVTVFTTGPYDCLHGRSSVEVGVHPNYERAAPREALESVLSAFPSAVGHRGHSLHFSERLRPLFYEKGILYDSSLWGSDHIYCGR